MPDVDLSTILQLTARHFLTSVGLWLAGHGYLDSSAVQGFVGAGMILWGIAWSIWQKDGVAWLRSEKTRLEKLAAIYERQLRAAKAPGAQPLAPLVGTQGKL